MFDANFDLEDAQAANDTLQYLIRGRKAGRFRADIDPLDIAVPADTSLTQ